MKTQIEDEVGLANARQVLGPGEMETELSASFNGSQPQSMLCPNCGSRLEGRKCKLFCQRPGCGYLVTYSEW